MRTGTAAPETEASYARERARGELTLTPELIESYMEYIKAKGHSPGTQAKYRKDLERLYESLPEPKKVREGTMEEIREQLVEAGYAARTINSCLSAANGLMKWCGMRELMLPDRLDEGEVISPELTRTEYRRILSTAKILGKEREYLLIKLFATTGISLGELKLVTVEAAEKGSFMGEGHIVRIPEGLRRELADYAARSYRKSGPIFVGRNGKALIRTTVTGLTQSLCEEARVEKEKASPRCLKKLYQSTQDGIMESMSVLMEQTYDRLLETEQLTIGWEVGLTR